MVERNVQKGFRANHRELCGKTLRSLNQKKKRQWIMVERNVHKGFRANPPRTLRKNFAFIASKKTPMDYG